jgi:hypothetical protein
MGTQLPAAQYDDARKFLHRFGCCKRIEDPNGHYVNDASRLRKQIYEIGPGKPSSLGAAQELVRLIADISIFVQDSGFK